MGYVRLLFFTAIVLISSRLSAQCINTYPFLEDFEASNGNWTIGGVNSDWTWGAPSKARINAAGSGTNCWITGGLASSVYNGGQRSWIESPCFDFSTLQRPYVRFLIYWDTERQYDGGNLQYSTNNGVTWQNVGNSATNVHCRILNWFNSPGINNIAGLATPQQGWSGTTLSSSGNCLGGNGSGGWKTAQYCLENLKGETDVIFRFTFGSGTSCNNYDGLAIDSFAIADFDEPLVDFSYVCNGERKVDFTAAAVSCPSGIIWDFDDPASTMNSATSLSASHEFSGPGLYEVKLSVTEPCIGTYVRSRTVIIPDVESTLYPPSCPGISDGAIQLESTPYPGLTFSWNLPGNPAADSVGGLAAGNYQVIVNVDSGCAQVLEIDLEDNPDGLPKTDLADVALICPPETLLAVPGNFDSYLWSDGSTDPTLLIEAPGTYTVTVTNAAGCTGEDSMRVEENCFTDVFVPTAFSPNRDQKNELFMPVAGEVEKLEFRVYNRFGQEIFYTPQQFVGWDGTYGGSDAPEGIYMWMVKFTGPDRKNRTFRGVFLLIR
jgi:gliding motility-associated-like protein